MRMRAIRRGVLVLAGWLCCFGAAAQTDRFPQVAAAYLVEYGQRELWSGNAEKRLPPASLTKIMTALLVLEADRLLEVVTVSRAAAQQGGTRLHLKAGEKLTVGALLAAALIGSANDACGALAEHHAGSVAAFVAQMNARAAALGLADTRFANPCGFDAPAHYSSARDLARLAHAALAFPAFADLVSRPDVRIATADGRRSFRIRNRNALIGNYAPAIGVKTGYTRRAGRCLIALAQKDGARVMVVMLDARSRWWDTIGIVEHAFDAGAHGPG
jgi:D-alanyl-D-alanine carboxypeptidase (penicillin-binding protein 5/6)